MTNNDKLSMGFSGLLVVCALFVVGLLVQRNFFPSKPKPQMRQRTVNNWQKIVLTGQHTGPKNAPVQIVEFFDYQCPYCKEEQPVVKALHRKYPEKVTVIRVNFPLQSHQAAFGAAIAAECARRQKLKSFMAYHDGLFAHQNKLGQTAFYQTLAANVGITDTVAFDQCQDNNATEVIIRDGEKLGKKIKYSWYSHLSGQRHTGNRCAFETTIKQTGPTCLGRCTEMIYTFQYSNV